MNIDWCVFVYPLRYRHMGRTLKELAASGDLEVAMSTVVTP